jgi:hypothetical protein
MEKIKNNYLLTIILLILFVVFPLKNEQHLTNNRSLNSNLVTNISLKKEILSARNQASSKKPSAKPSPTSIATPYPSPLNLNGFYPMGILDETGSMSESSSSDWWLNSGGLVTMNGQSAQTIQGNLQTGSKWQTLYAQSNPTDTDNGLHPQNIFRLVTRNSWQNYQQQAYFKINKYNTSNSTNRNASNGFLLFNRYQNADTLYYTGLRVDGATTIKKKINGTYYTMAYKPYYSGIWNRDGNPNLIPVNTWIGLRSIVKNENNIVHIEIYIDPGKTGNWIKAVESFDNGVEYGGAAITQPGYAGIRTDFMDAEFSDYKISSL